MGVKLDERLDEELDEKLDAKVDAKMRHTIALSRREKVRIMACCNNLGCNR